MFRVKYWTDFNKDLRKYMSTKEYTVFAVDRDDDGEIFLVYDCGWLWINSTQCEPIYK